MSASRRFGDRGAFRVLPLHSSLSPTEQSAVFDRMPHGVRKVQACFPHRRPLAAPGHGHNCPISPMARLPASLIKACTLTATSPPTRPTQLALATIAKALLTHLPPV